MEIVCGSGQELVASPQLIRIPDRKPKSNYYFGLARIARSYWTKAGSACVCGIGFGLVAAALAAPRVDSTSRAITHVAAAQVQSSDLDELSSVKARNRRLEALVEVLRARAQHSTGLRDQRLGQNTRPQ
ncbi:MAG: hypothetical protein JOZ48_10575 [Acidobacteriaceae bacterium]|nr:hypothetical protein [Acidobacteriaceae bacterium]